MEAKSNFLQSKYAHFFFFQSMYFFLPSRPDIQLFIQYAIEKLIIRKTIQEDDYFDQYFLYKSLLS
jgi:hypothetical protein